MTQDRKFPAGAGLRAAARAGMFQAVLLGGGLIVAYHLLIGPPLDVPAANLAKSVLMQLFGVLLPGSALYVLLYPSRQNIFGALFLSYAFGYAANIASYFLLVPFGLQAVVPYFVALLALLSLWVLWKRGGQIMMDKLTRMDLVYAALFLLYLCMHAIVTAGVVAPPSVTGSLSCHQDHWYWIENAAALAIQFPPRELRLAVDATYYYHYFSSVQLAFSSLATGIDIFTIGGVLFPLTQCLLFFGSFYALFRGAVKSRLLPVFGVIIICFCTGMEGLTFISYTSHTWTHPFGFDIGFAFGALFLHCFLLQYGKDRFDMRACGLSLLTLAVTVGAKAPVGVVVIIAAGMICFSWLLKKQFRLAFSYGLALIAVFLIIAIGCVGMLKASFGDPGATRFGNFSMTQFIDYSPVTQAIQQVFAEGLPRWLRGIVLVGTALFCTHPLAVGLYGMGTLSILTDRRMRNPLCIALACSSFLGLLLGLFNIQSGISQMYFSMGAFIPCLFLGLIWLDTAAPSWELSGKRMAAILCGILLVVQVNFMLFRGGTYLGPGLICSLRIGSTVLFDQERAQKDFVANAIQASDAEAMAWIRENTPRDSILLSDRGVVCNIPTYMYYGAFSERQMYLEGDVYFLTRYTDERARMREIVQGVFQNSEEALETAIADGVDYIVQTIWATPDFSPDPSLAELVYSNETIRVYEVIL